MACLVQFVRKTWNDVFKDEEKERKERERKEEVIDDIRRFGYKMEEKARAHYLCAERYGKWQRILIFPLLIVGGALAGYRELVDVKLLKPAGIMIAISILAVAVHVIGLIYRGATDSYEKHNKAETNCQSMAERASSLRKRACNCTESASSIRDRFDKLLEANGNSSEIRPEEWAMQKASKK